MAAGYFFCGLQGQGGAEMYSVKFVTRKDPETVFYPFSFSHIVKVLLSYKAGFGLFWVVIHEDGTKTYITHKYYTIGEIREYERANNEND